MPTETMPKEASTRIESEKAEKLETEKPTQVETRFKDVLELMKSKDIKLDYKDAETLRYLYWEEELKPREIGELFGRSEATIWILMRKNGIRFRRKWTPITAELGVKVIKQRGKDGLYRVRSIESQAVSCLVDLNAKTCTCQDFTNSGAKCEHIKLVENLGEIRLRRKRENERARYHSNPEIREKSLEANRKLRLKLQEDYERYKVEYGGKCVLCRCNDLDVLVPHHPLGKEEKDTTFWQSKEFTLWREGKLKPKVVLLCANCHLKVENVIRHGEVDPYDLRKILQKQFQ